MFQIVCSTTATLSKWQFSKTTDKQKIGENSYGNFLKDFSKLFFGPFKVRIMAISLHQFISLTFRIPEHVLASL
jgi:hypothetical protein